MDRFGTPIAPGTPVDTALVVGSVRAVLLSAPLSPEEELHWVGGRIASWDAGLVEVTLADGTTGVGEAGAAIMAAAAIPGIVAALRPYLEGRSFASALEVGDDLRSHTAFWSRGGIASGVVGAVELACLDAVGRREGVPVHTLLGGARRDRVEAYASGGLGSDFDQVARWVDAQLTAGFSTVKFRAMRDAATTIELVQEIAPRIPTGARFVLDAVQGCASAPWPLEDVLAVGRVAASAGARWFEEPCQADDLVGYASVRAELDVPISGVESNGTVREFDQLISAGGIDIAQPDATFVGGAVALGRVAALAASAGIDCVPHVWGSGVTFQANLHAVIASPSIELFEFCTLPNPLRDALTVDPPRLVEGMLAAPSGPGLGVAVTAEIEERFPYRPGGGHVIR